MEQSIFYNKTFGFTIFRLILGVCIVNVVIKKKTILKTLLGYVLLLYIMCNVGCILCDVSDFSLQTLEFKGRPIITHMSTILNLHQGGSHMYTISSKALYMAV